jgi:hypothetical protein
LNNRRKGAKIEEDVRLGKAFEEKLQQKLQHRAKLIFDDASGTYLKNMCEQRLKQQSMQRDLQTAFDNLNERAKGVPYGKG